MLETYHDVDWKAMMEEGEKGMSEEEIRRTNWKKPGKRSKKKQLKEELKQAAALECAKDSEPQGSADGAAMVVDEASPSAAQEGVKDSVERTSPEEATAGEPTRADAESETAAT